MRASLKLVVFAAMFFAWLFCLYSSEQPFRWTYKEAGGVLKVSVEAEQGFYLYSENTSLELKDKNGNIIKSENSPFPAEHINVMGEKESVYAGPATFSWDFKIVPDTDYNLTIKFRGCRISPFMCFMPQTMQFNIGSTDAVRAIQDNPVNYPKSASLESTLGKFKVSDRAGGYMDVHAFASFLKGVPQDDIFYNKSIIVVILIVLLGGLALNLTPCVLPLIPVNLAIIGAGAKSSSRMGGLLRGSAYGAGITIAYGTLGLLTVFAGARFGALNSSAVFNFTVAAVFIILALAMFDVINIDFSRFSRNGGPKSSQKNGLLTAFLLGAGAALLAGACVAPVLIATLIYSSSLASKGNYLGFILPFFLGLGMALPWPLAGAGIAALPKPGKWMLRVKYVFGIFIIMMAAYYAYIGYGLVPFSSAKFNPSAELAAFKNSLDEAYKEHKPVLIDFWATWCKNCKAMEETTLKDDSVKIDLRGYKLIKFQSEKPDDPQIKAVLNYFAVDGFPYYIILEPVSK